MYLPPLNFYQAGMKSWLTEDIPFFFIQFCGFFDFSKNVVYLAGQHIMLQTLQEVNHVIKNGALHRSELSQLQLTEGVTLRQDFQCRLLQLQKELKANTGEQVQAHSSLTAGNRVLMTHRAPVHSAQLYGSELTERYHHTSRTLSLPSAERPHPQPPVLSRLFLATTKSTSSLCWLFWAFHVDESYNMWFFVIGFFHLE